MVTGTNIQEELAASIFIADFQRKYGDCTFLRNVGPCLPEDHNLNE
jgi:hypothetical protein